MINWKHLWVDEQSALKDPDPVCHIHGCGKPPRVKGLCKNHYASYRRGTINREGGRKKPLIRYGHDFGCIICGATIASGKTGRIIRGFCLFHYGQHKRGVYDFDGVRRRKARIYKYSTTDRCRVCECNDTPYAKEFCKKHYDSYCKGLITTEGIRVFGRVQGKPSCHCGKPSTRRGLCREHYRASRPECTILGCHRPRVAHGICEMHYARRRRRAATKQSPAGPAASAES